MIIPLNSLSKDFKTQRRSNPPFLQIKDKSPFFSFCKYLKNHKKPKICILIEMTMQHLDLPVELASNEADHQVHKLS